MGDIFHDLVDAGEHAVDGVEHVGEAAWDTAAGVGQFGAATAEHLAATGAELVGAQDTRDTLDNMAVDTRDASYQSFGQAADNLGDAASDVDNP